jgi:hypothetical protein
MADSTSNIDTISASQAAKEVTANGLFDSFSPASQFGRRASTCVGLTWGYYGGVVDISGTPTTIANGTVTLTASTTNYVKRSGAGVVSVVTSAPSGWPGPLSAGVVALYTVVTGSSTVTSWTDHRLGVGSSYPVAATYADIAMVIDGNGSPITTGIKGDIEIPFACTINAATLLADQTGSVVVDLWKDTSANYPPTGADSICASAKPTLSSAIKSQDSTLTGWTTSIAAGDIIRVNVDSASTVTRVTLSVKVTRV